jgi:hypothetical protein
MGAARSREYCRVRTEPEVLACCETRVVHGQKDRWHWIVHDIWEVPIILNENVADVGGQREAISWTFRRPVVNTTARHQLRIGILDSELVRWQIERFQSLPEKMHGRDQAHVIQFDLFVEGCLSYGCLTKRSGFAWLSLGANQIPFLACSGRDRGRE